MQTLQEFKSATPSSIKSRHSRTAKEERPSKRKRLPKPSPKSKKRDKKDKKWIMTAPLGTTPGNHMGLYGSERPSKAANSQYDSFKGLLIIYSNKNVLWFFKGSLIAILIFLLAFFFFLAHFDISFSQMICNPWNTEILQGG